MNIEKVDIQLLNPATYNPRKDLNPSDPEYIKLKNSIEHFGYVEPIIVNKRNNVVVGGHQRLKVLIDLGYKDVDVIYVDLDDTNEKALNVALNKISGDWDADKLEDLLRELVLDDTFNQELTGFTNAEIDELFGSVEEVDNEPYYIARKEIDGDDFDHEKIKEKEDNPRGIKLGDVFRVGRHTLICGDSTDKRFVDALIKDKKVDLVMMDPPYDMEYSERKGLESLQKSMHKTGDYVQRYIESNRGRDTSILIQEISNFDVQSIAFIEKYNFPALYIFTSVNGIKHYLDIFKDWQFKLVTWCKKNPTPFCNNNFYPDCEYMLYFNKGSKNGRIWNNKLSPTSIYKQYYISIKEEGILDNGNERVHPTMKPLQLLSDKMQICSNPDSVILDLFGGSGSTMVVAEQLGRECLMMEYSPKYINVILDRMEKLGLKAEKIGHLDFTNEIEKHEERLNKEQ